MEEADTHVAKHGVIFHRLHSFRYDDGTEEIGQIADRTNHGPASRIIGNVLNEKERLETQVEKLLAERDLIRMKVEGMLDAVAALDPEMVEELSR